jgi:hypothetical protein
LKFCGQLKGLVPKKKEATHWPARVKRVNNPMAAQAADNSFFAAPLQAMTAPVSSKYRKKGASSIFHPFSQPPTVAFY